MVCGRLGFLVRLFDLMAVVQNAAGKSNPSHHLPVHWQTGMLWRSGKTEFIFTYLLLLDEHRLNS